MAKDVSAHCGITHTPLAISWGKRTAKILRRPTHCILLSAEANETAHWQSFVTAEDCSILAIFQSCLVKLPDRQLDKLDSTARSAIQTNLPTPQGTFVNLSRDLGSDCYEEAIAQFADWLIQTTQAK